MGPAPVGWKIRKLTIIKAGYQNFQLQNIYSHCLHASIRVRIGKSSVVLRLDTESQIFYNLVLEYLLSHVTQTCHAKYIRLTQTLKLFT